MINHSHIISSVLICATAALSAHVFTDDQGNTAKAKIVATTPGDQVVLKSPRGEITLPIAKLVESDQKLIDEWRKKNPDKVRCNLRFQVFRDEIYRKASADTRSQFVDYDEKLRTIPRHTSLSIYNENSGTIPKLKLVVHAFVEDFVDTDKGDYRKYSVGTRAISAPVKQYRGEVTADNIKAGGRVDIDYGMDLHYYVDRDGGRVDESARDQYLGVWIRAFIGGSMVAEYKKQEKDLMRNQQWDDRTKFKLQSVTHEVK